VFLATATGEQGGDDAKGLEFLNHGVYQLPFATTIASCGIIGVIDTTVSGLDYYLKDEIASLQALPY